MARLVAIVIILNAEGIDLILAVDRVLDMCRTAVNIFNDSCGAVIIGRSQGGSHIPTAAQGSARPGCRQPLAPPGFTAG